MTTVSPIGVATTQAIPQRKSNPVKKGAIIGGSVGGATGFGFGYLVGSSLTGGFESELIKMGVSPLKTKLGLGAKIGLAVAALGLAVGTGIGLIVNACKKDKNVG